MVKLSGRDALRCPSRARRQSAVWDGDEIQRVPAVVADLDQRELIVGLHDRPDRSGWPAPRVDKRLHHIQNLVPRICHRPMILAARYGMSIHVDVRRGGRSRSTIQVVTTGCVAPSSPSIMTTTS